MYDQREKAQRDHQWALDSAREEGREQGLELGAHVGKIQLLQQLLGETPLSTASLLERSTDQLSKLLGDLQQRLWSRENG